jgi:lipoate---protein ligase
LPKTKQGDNEWSKSRRQNGDHVTRIPDIIRLLDTGPLTAAENMALDDIILEEVDVGRSPTTVRFLQFSPPAALVGGHQDVALEIREDYCRRRGVDINRRITGGGAIYFQDSALGWEVFARIDQALLAGSYDRIQAMISEAAVTALRRLGVTAGFRPRNDIEVKGRKISGTGGAWSGNAFMFQGTLLIENEIEEFLRCLRVPVEKLKKREIESLQQRVCFLSDLLDPLPSIDTIKQAFVQAFSELFGSNPITGTLTESERLQLHKRRAWYESPKWVYGRGIQKNKDEAHIPRYSSLYQTTGGTMRVHIWLETRRPRIRQVLICGDFFCRPTRLVMDLEAALKGVPFTSENINDTVTRFLTDTMGEFPGIDAREVAQAVASPVQRKRLENLGLTPDEVNELFIVNLDPGNLDHLWPRFLLLPYCSKDVACDWRKIPDCARCGQCDFDRMYDFGESRAMEVFSIQSFEHLMDVLLRIRRRDGIFIGSCCEAFYSKHQKEMEATGARGLLINLDSTTCYDLGKGMEAYVGEFDHQTEMNCALIEKVIGRVGKRRG